MTAKNAAKTISAVAEKLLKTVRKTRNDWLCNPHADALGRVCVLDGYRAYRINLPVELSTVPARRDSDDDKRFETVFANVFNALDKGKLVPIPAPDPLAVSMCAAHGTKSNHAVFDLGDNAPELVADYLLDALKLFPGAAWYKTPGAQGMTSPVFVVHENGNAAILPVRGKNFDDKLGEAAPVTVTVPTPDHSREKPAAESFADVLAAAPASRFMFDVFRDCVQYSANGRKTIFAPTYTADANAAKITYATSKGTGTVTFAAAHNCYLPVAVLAGIIAPAAALANIADALTKFASDNVLSQNAIERCVTHADHSVSIVRNAECVPDADNVRTIADALDNLAAKLYGANRVKPTDVKTLDAAAKWLRRALAAAPAAPVKPAAEKPAEKPAKPAPAEMTPEAFAVLFPDVMTPEEFAALFAA